MDNRYQQIENSKSYIHITAHLGDNSRVGWFTVIDQHCYIGNNVFIGNNCTIKDYTRICSNSVIGHNVVIEEDVTIGNDVTIQPLSYITKGATIEDNVFIGPCFCGANTKKIVHGRNYPLVLEPYIIRRAVRIGAHVTILPGVVIGENALIGAGSLVVKNVPPREKYIGTPVYWIGGNVPAEEIL